MISTDHITESPMISTDHIIESPIISTDHTIVIIMMNQYLITNSGIYYLHYIEINNDQYLHCTGRMKCLL